MTASLSFPGVSTQYRPVWAIQDYIYSDSRSSSLMYINVLAKTIGFSSIESSLTSGIMLLLSDSHWLILVSSWKQFTFSNKLKLSLQCIPLWHGESHIPQVQLQSYVSNIRVLFSNFCNSDLDIMLVFVAKQGHYGVKCQGNENFHFMQTEAWLGSTGAQLCGWAMHAWWLNLFIGKRVRVVYCEVFCIGMPFVRLWFSSTWQICAAGQAGSYNFSSVNTVSNKLPCRKNIKQGTIVGIQWTSCKRYQWTLKVGGKSHLWLACPTFVLLENGINKE